VNGTTGYEEGAAQGLMAGINAHRRLHGQEPLVLKRDEAYIGVLIDDLVMKGVDEPYRMFTSRAEYRILLRQDNADARLTPLGYKIGLVGEEKHERLLKKNAAVESFICYLQKQPIRIGEIDDYLKTIGEEPLSQGKRAFDIVLRSNVTINGLSEAFPKIANYIKRNELSQEIIEQAEIRIKYRGYIEREKYLAEKMQRLENITIPADFNYEAMQSLTIEARQKLSRIRPTTLGQASRIPGVSPADINVLLIKFGR
jgi:tRNA uridine 5-carboxymethylaminomethyl modification enzyme